PLPAETVLDLRTDLGERLHAQLPDLLQLQDVPAELGPDRLGDLAGLEAEGDPLELRHHRPPLEEAQVATVRGAAALAALLCQLGEVHARLARLHRQRDRLAPPLLHPGLR